MRHRRESFIRIHVANVNAIGPGKANLLEAIAEFGSIAGAARQLRMSYRRAWMLTKSLNACFRGPLVETIKGGPRGGGARLTGTGREVLKLYRQMEAHATEAIADEMHEFKKLIVERTFKK
ncbi:MAG: LysR family transcriptional regulator [Proteobacteria bacterium]|nr:LysR family transcriptional regulator [Pseudomonadota bacterium]MCH8098480.1 LysR family transcriptional regulator [Pseudomonadota bacterium]